MAGLVPAIHVGRHARKDVDARDEPGHDDGVCGDFRQYEARDRDRVPYSSSLASTPFTAFAQPFNFRSRVAWLMLGLKRCSRRQLSPNLAGSG